VRCGCGKQLRARAALAGKRVKCPQCGEAVLVPGVQAARPGSGRWPGGAALLLLLGLGVTVPLVRGGAGPQAAPAGEYYHSFKDHPEDRSGWALFGPDAGDYVKFEPAGLRITLPAGFPPDRPSVGVIRAAPVKGDFEITVSFEILQEPVPTDTVKQTRLSLVAALDRPDVNMATLSRAAIRQGPQYLTWLTLWSEAAGKAQRRFDPFPAAGKAGKLRLVRTGPVLSYQVAAADAQEFTVLQEYPFSGDDLTDVRLTATTGGPQAALDLRVLDCRIRAASVAEAAAVPSPEAPRGKPWLPPALAVFGALALLLAGGFVLYRRRAAGRMLEPAAVKSGRRP
jgi:hypothetical protein